MCAAPTEPEVPRRSTPSSASAGPEGKWTPFGPLESLGECRPSSGILTDTALGEVLWRWVRELVPELAAGARQGFPHRGRSATRRERCS